MMKILKSLLKMNTIRRKMLIFSLLISILFWIISGYTFFNASKFIDSLDIIFTNNVYLSEISVRLNKIDESVMDYLSTKDTDSFDEYIRNSDNLKIELDKLNRQISNNKTQLMLKDIANMTDGYLNKTDEAIAGKRARNIGEYNKKYKEAKKISGYIDYYINLLNLNQFSDNTNKYLYMSSELKTLQIINIIIILITCILNIVLIVAFTDKISIPIVKLAGAADEISNGNFECEDVIVKTDDEIKVMADAFNRMKNSIGMYIDEVKTQSEIEARLMNEKMNNLEMKNLLKNAQIKALQSQINPHFLFNTLNAAVQLSMLEEADRTGMFLENMAQLFRYNLKKMDEPVTLKEEIQNLKNYVYLLKTRFGDLIEFDFKIDECVLDIEMPVLILQPIVENACIHGIGDMECGGKVCLAVEKVDDRIKVVIEDNGKGISDETIERILKGEKVHGKDKKGHTTGIGLTNVIERLKIYFDIENIIDIESIPNKYTKVSIIMPTKQ